MHRTRLTGVLGILTAQKIEEIKHQLEETEMPEVNVRKSRRVVNPGDSFNELTFLNELDIAPGKPITGMFRCSCGDVSKYTISVVTNGGRKRCKKCMMVLNGNTKRKYPVNDHVFDDMTTEFASYTLGLFFADGTVRRQGGTLSLSLVESDVAILDKIRNVVQPTKPLHYCNVSNGRNQYRISISSIPIRDKFIEYGCVPNKSVVLRYPVLPVSHKDFIRGYIDGDGHVSRKNLMIMGTKSFLESVKSIIESHLCRDISVRFYRKKSVITDNYAMSISFVDDRYDVLEWVYGGSPGFFLDRKMDVYVNEYKNRGRKGEGAR